MLRVGLDVILCQRRVMLMQLTDWAARVHAFASSLHVQLWV